MAMVMVMKMVGQGNKIHLERRRSVAETPGFLTEYRIIAIIPVIIIRTNSYSRVGPLAVLVHYL